MQDFSVLTEKRKRTEVERMNEKLFLPNEAAAILGIATSTLRKWSISLEKAGYPILRNDNGERAYRDNDLVSLRKYKKYLDRKIGQENAAISVYRDYREEKGELVTPPVIQNQAPSMRPEDLEKMLGDVIEKKVQEALEKQKTEILERLERHDQLLMENLRMMQEVKQGQLQIAAAEEKEKKWWKIW
jgi:DNA-binding transcriptional MerR regulator